MKNVETEIKGTILTIKVDLSKDQGPSKTGKSIIVATTEGNVEIQPQMFFGMNIYRK